MKSTNHRSFLLSPIPHVLTAGVAVLLLTGMLPVLGQGAATPMAKPYDMKSEAGRAAAVAELRAKANNEKEVAERAAQARGWEIRGKDSQGRTFELMRLDKNGLPLYNITANANSAISTGANLIRNTAPYNLNGAGFRVGVWDGGSILTNHQEFIGRAFVMDGSGPEEHATHVGGTIGASGVDPNAQGMAPSVRLDSYDWNQDLAEMTQAAATTTNYAGKILVSNHSYAALSGWSGTSYWGAYPEREDAKFGQYSDFTASLDQICVDAPYYLPFWAAGNDRGDDGPNPGQTFSYLTQSGWVEKTYDPAVDPLPDGWDNGGFDTMGTWSCGKNVMTVGAVNDAVTNGVRSVVNGTMSDFSSWGPTDDGRIKPDLVADGVNVYSASNTATNAYKIESGTSMAAPNAAGSAILLQQLYATTFGHVMRASTLKALLLHTADDLGNPGPDYIYGWGLMNVKAAADHILNPATKSIIEGQLANNTTNTYIIHWAGGSPVRATLCWTDPAGSVKTALDDRTRVLVNDLDIRAQRQGVTYYPYVLDVYHPANPATTGDNITDNVEQILIIPASAGDYTITVSHKGTLAGGEQQYALILSFGNATLTPQQPAGWSDKIVVSTGTGTSTDSTILLPTDPLYVDFSILNNGVAAIAAGWSAELYVDGVLKTNVSGGFLSAGGYQSWSDLNIGSLPSGAHTLRIQAYAGGMVPEDENEYSKTILISGANDNFASAQTLFGDSGTVAGSNVGATKEPGEPNHAGYPGGRSVWYHWTVPTSGQVTIDTFFSTFDTLLGVYTGNSVNALTLVASNDEYTSLISQSGVTFNAVAGTSLWIAVDGYGGASGNITLDYAVVPVLPLTPVVTTLPATSITATNATLNGTVIPNGLATTAYFQYSLTTNYGTVTPPVMLSSGWALDFNGTDQFATTSSGVNLSNRSFSVEFWARRDGYNRWDMPLTQGTANTDHGLHVGFRDANTFAFAFWGDDLDASADYSDNAWHHWACTYNQTNNQRFIYRDGVVIATDTATGPYLENSPLLIARSAQLNANFGGTLDEVRVWKGVRTPEQINAFLNTTVAGTETNLLAYWRFDEGTGASAGDSSGHANTATLIGSPAWITGMAVSTPPGRALVFNGTNQFATTSSNVDLVNRSFSVEFWARRDGANRWDMPLTKGTSDGSHGLQVGFRPDNLFTFAFWGDDLYVSANYSDNAWHHWACTYNQTNNQRFIYRDGVVVAFDTAKGPYLENSPLLIAYFAQIDTYFGGALDEVRVWNGVRTPAQINAGLNTTVTGTESNLLAYWRFDEGTGASAGDSSGHANTATLIGSPAWITGITVPALPVNAPLAALTSGTLYHYRLAASGSAGTYFGNDMVFTTASSSSQPVNFRLAGARVSAGGAFQMNFTNLSGLPFTVLGTTNLALPLTNWTVLGPVIESPAGSGQYQFTDSQTTNSRGRFYRVRSP